MESVDKHDPMILLHTTQCNVFSPEEASEDFLTMIEGIVGLTEYYCRRAKENNQFVFFYREELDKMW